MTELLYALFMDSDALPPEPALQNALKTLAREPLLIRDFWDNEVSRELVLTGFDEYGPRLRDLLQLILDTMKCNVELSAKIAAGFLDHLVKPMIKSDFEDVESHLDTVLDIVIVLLQLFRGITSPFITTLESLLSVASQREKLAGLLFADKGPFLVMKSTFFGNQSNFTGSSRTLTATTIHSLTTVLLDVSLNCNKHFLKHEREQWHQLTRLVYYLDDLYTSRGVASRSVQTDISKIPFNRLRKLDKDEKKSSSRQLNTLGLPKIIISEQYTDFLGNFDLPIPANDMEVLNTKDHLATVCATNILLKVLDTFPCDNCLASLRIGESQEKDEYLAGDVLERLDMPDIGVWRILMTGQAFSDLNELHSTNLFHDAKLTLEKIATGEWRKRSSITKPYQHPNLRLPVFRAVYGNNGRILWNVSLAFDASREMVSQVVKVWRIGDHKEVRKSLPFIARALKSHSIAFIEECKARSYDDTSGARIPRLSGEEMLRSNATEDLNLTRSEALSLHQAMVTGKSYSLTQHVFEALEAGASDIEIPFELSKSEIEIVSHNETPAFVQGRSGTGKTSCLVFRLFTRFLIKESLGLRKQVFITKSPVLAEKIREYLTKLINCRLTTFGGENAQALLSTEAPLDIAEMQVSDVRESCLPLVCTFEELLMLIENTIKAALKSRRNSNLFSGPAEPSSSLDSYRSRARSGSLAAKHSSPCRPAREVNFETFKYDYWPTFPDWMRKELVPDVLFSEILGVVKGSKQSIASLKDLTLQEYLLSSTRSSSFFQHEGERELVYKAFLCYEKTKAAYGDWDGIDRARSLLSNLRENRTIRQQVQNTFSEVYVDEIQDIRMLEIFILFNLVRNPLGITLAGDTAQCISKDSTFRFQDVKHSFYEHFQSFAQFSGSQIAAKPTLFPLCENYRSHQGVLGLASIMTDYLCKLFPESIDKLPPEVGKFSGPLPVLLVGFEKPYVKRVFAPSEGTNSISTFGANQVVLVRDQKMVKAARDTLGSDVMILDIMQSKGLEYEDVLLFNFFSDHDCLNESGFRELAQTVKMKRWLELDKTKYAGLCSELKSLYVAITRCQSRLWIYEEDHSAAEPFLSLCIHTKDEPLIDVVYPGSSKANECWREVFSRNEANDDPKLWEKRGYEFLAKTEYEIAEKCFSRANSTVGKALARAYLARVEVTRNWNTDLLVAKRKLHEAATLFREAGAVRDAARTYEDWGFYAEAADLWLELEQFVRAAELREKLGDFLMAADLYHVGSKYDEAANALQRGRHYTELLQYMSENKPLMDPGRYGTLSRLCNALSRKGVLSTDYGSKLVQEEETDEEKEKFFRENKIYEQLADLLVKKERIPEAWDLWVGEKEFDKALSITDSLTLGKHIPRSQDIRKVLHYALAQKAFRRKEDTLDIVDLAGYVNYNSSGPSDDIFNPLVMAWRNLVKILGTNRADGIFRPWDTDRKKIDDPFVREVFDLHSLLTATSTIARVQNVSELPLEQITSMIRILQPWYLGASVPASIQLYSGIFEPPNRQGSDETEYDILHWSPYLNKPEVRGKAMIDEIKSSTAVLLVEASLKALERVERLWPWPDDRSFWRTICWHFATRGYCGRGDCSGTHSAFPTCAEYEAELKALEIPIYRYFEDTGDRPDEYLASGLENLLFYRLKKNWSKEGVTEVGDKVSLLLDQLNLAEFITEITSCDGATRKLHELLRGLYKQMEKSDTLQKRHPVLKNSLDVMKFIVPLLSHFAEDLCEREQLVAISHIMDCMGGLGPTMIHFTAFHAVLSLMDKILMELLLTFRVEDLILPLSWICRFKIVQRGTRSSPPSFLPSSDMCSCLASVLTRLFWLETALDRRNIRFDLEYSNHRSPYSKDAMRHRIRDILLIALTNMQISETYKVERIQHPPGFQRELSSWLSRHERVRISSSYLIRECARHFNAYGDKEGIAILKLHGSSAHNATSADKLATASGIHVTHFSLNPAEPQTVSRTQSHSTTPSVTSNQSSPEEHVDKTRSKAEEVKAAKYILRFWRQRKNRYLGWKIFQASVLFEGWSAVEKILRSHAVCPQTREHLRFKMTLRLHGPGTYLVVKAASQCLREFKAYCMDAMDKLDISEFDTVDRFQLQGAKCARILDEQNVFTKYRFAKVHHGEDVEGELRKLKKTAQKTIEGMAKLRKQLEEKLLANSK